MNKLQERRLELGMTQPQLSAMLKEADSRIDTGMVSRFERGACLPTPQVLKALESALQAPRTALFSADELTTIESAADAEPQGDAPAAVLRLVDKLGTGRKEAVTRTALTKALGVSDRKVRELIEQARRWGYIIINESQGKGYYLSDDILEIQKQYWSDRRRALSILARLKTMRAILSKAGRPV